MSTLKSRRSPLDVIRALRSARQLGTDLLIDPGYRESLAESLERRQLLTVTGAYIDPPGTATEGNSIFVYPEATTDHDPTATTWTIQFGDGATYSGTVNGATSIAHTYADEGTYSVNAQVSDGTGTGTYYYCSTTISVADAPLSPAGGMNTTYIGATEGITYNGTVANFTDGNPSETAAGYSAYIVYGDGATQTGASVVPDLGGGFDVVGSHAFAEEGSYGGYVAVFDDGGSTLVMYLNSTVEDAPLTANYSGLSTTEGTLFSGTIAHFFDANPGATTADFTSLGVDYGDGLDASAPTVVADLSGGFDIVATHTFTEAGTYSGSVSVLDEGGASLTMTLTSTVADATLSATGSDVSFTEDSGGGGQVNDVVATFTDSNTLSSEYSDMSAEIHWGDGTSSDGTIETVPGTPGAYAVLGSNQYSGNGPYTVTTDITDSGGATVETTSTAAPSSAGVKLQSLAKANLSVGDLSVGVAASAIYESAGSKSSSSGISSTTITVSSPTKQGPTGGSGDTLSITNVHDDSTGTALFQIVNSTGKVGDEFDVKVSSGRGGASQTIHITITN